MQSLEKCRCECSWIGKMSDLVNTTEDPEHYTYCPICGSEEIFYDEELTDDE